MTISEKTKIVYRNMSATDKSAFYDLVTQEYCEVFGSISINENETREFSNISGFSLAEDSYVAVHEGEFLGYCNVWALGDTPVRPSIFFYVAPHARAIGVEEILLQWGLKRAEHVYQRLPDNARVVVSVHNVIADFETILENIGFTTHRQILRMRIDFDAPPPKAKFPDGFHVVTMKEHPHLIDFVRVYRDSFRDLRGYVEDALENRLTRWQQDIEVHREFYRPENFLLLKEGENDAGVLMAWDASRFDEDIGWVSVLGILPQYRRLGLASNLLYHIFNNMYNNGREGVGLSVDGSSLTGANKLYEKVGMRPFVIINNYELELRSGIELSNQG